nr:hypothetical protein [Tanacetum cinerariifolium]
MKNISGTSVTPHVDKPKLSAITPLSKKLHVSMPSHSVPQPREFNVVKHRNVNPSQTPMVDLVPNKQSSASIRTNMITNSQRHIIVKENKEGDCVSWASSSGKKFGIGSSIKNFVESGPKVLRKSWEEGNVKISITQTRKEGPFDTNHYLTQVPRKSTSERTVSREEPIVKSSKVERKVKTPSKRAEVVDHDSSGKQKPSSSRKSSAEASANGLPGNLVNVSLSNRRLTAGGASWSSLPSSLAKLLHLS